MKINIKNLSLSFVALDILIMARAIPNAIVIFATLVTIFSLIISNSFWRTTLKVTFLILGLFLIRYIFKTFLVTEAGVSLVLILSTLKVWELDSESDHFNMFLILSLLESCIFLVDPTFLIFLLGFIKIVFYFYFILKIRNYDLSQLSFKRLFVLIIPSLLLSLLMFYTFPRFTQGFLSTGNQQLLFSGNDSQLNMKGLGNLKLSPQVVFRVYGLDHSQLTLPLLYWRTNILWDYYDEIWRSGYINLRSEAPLISSPNAGYRIRLTQDPAEFLPTLDGSSTILKSNLDFQFFSENSFRLKSMTKLDVNYETATNTILINKTLTPLMQKKGLKLRSTAKDKIAKMILSDKINLNAENKFKQVIAFFKSRHFEYSLSPASYKNVEDFILNGKTGYCSHFAASFTYMARAVGLPARIVSGYQGGEINPFDQSVIVRELDAHAWVEIYFEDKGWLRIDPTAMVVPARIALGSSLFHDKLEPYISLFYFNFPKSLLRFSSLDKFNLYLDSLNSSFNSEVFNFDKEKQQKVLSSLLPANFSLGWPFVFSLLIFLSVLPFLFIYFSTKRSSLEKRKYQRFLKKMKRLGLEKHPGETALQFGSRCGRALPQKAAMINLEIKSYIDTFYL